MPRFQGLGFLRWIEREFYRFDDKIVDALADPTLSAEERSELLRQRAVLWERYHLVTKRGDTHRKVREIGKLLLFVAQVARMIAGSKG